MLFNSIEFIFLFLPIALMIYFALTRSRWAFAAKAWLVCISLFFYSWWNVKYLSLLLASIGFNYSVSKLLISCDGRAAKRTMIFVFGVTGNILLLAYFKYVNFFIKITNWTFNSDLAYLSIILPLGISFFTITQITYLVDCYEGLVKETNWLNYTLFVAFFPHLLMGPILHHKQMMTQFESETARLLDGKNIARGLFLFFIGLLKKLAIADTFAIWANLGFDTLTAPTVLEAWLASLSYTMQLYFDFSGYTDMALGVALLFNIRLPINFNTPYKSTSIIEFWQRWHISLTSFITTYLYTPILKSFGKITFANSMIAIFLALLIVGLWHGAHTTFLVFYFAHACGLAVNHYWRRKRLKLNKLVSWFITFNFINITFVVFRAKSLTEALKVLQGMAGANGLVLPEKLTGHLGLLTKYGVQFGKVFFPGGFVLLFVIFLIIATVMKNSQEISETLEPNWVTTIIFAVLATYSILLINKESPFLYFAF